MDISARDPSSAKTQHCMLYQTACYASFSTDMIVCCQFPTSYTLNSPHYFCLPIVRPFATQRFAAGWLRDWSRVEIQPKA